jgi:hypothetical protein
MLDVGHSVFDVPIKTTSGGRLNFLVLPAIFVVYFGNSTKLPSANGHG